MLTAAQQRRAEDVMTQAAITGALLRAEYTGETGDHAHDSVKRIFYVTSDLLYTKKEGAPFFRVILPFEDDAERSLRVERFDTVPEEVDATHAEDETCPECGVEVSVPTWGMCGKCAEAERSADWDLEREAGF